MHESLSIVRGVMKTPGDTLSAENGTDAINLMDSLGFMIEPDGWQPQLPSLKNGGVWADSAVNTGRLLVAGQDSNVTETIRLTISLGDYVSLYSMIARLQRFITDCRKMWTTFYQIEPVFLAWKAIGAPDSQYALIFNIDVDIQYPDIEQSPTADITLTLEREPYWRALPPGMNPKVWAYYARGELMNAAIDYSLTEGTTEHFIYDADVCNRMEFNNANLAQSSITARNYIDIPGERIPGDAPALMQMAIVAEISQADLRRLYIARDTRPKTLPSRAGGTISNYPLISTFNACNAAMGADAATAADTGGVRDYAGNQERVNISFATTTNDSARVTWDLTEGLSMAALRGRYAAYVRARQVNGVSGDINMHLTISPQASGVETVLPDVTPVLLGTTGNSTGANGGWPLSYMGTLNFPFKGRTVMSSNGNGVSVDSNMRVVLYAERTTGVGVLYICDLILIPFDEYSCFIVGGDSLFNPILGSTTAFLGDETGYLSHGSQDVITQSNEADSVEGSLAYDNNELRGQWPQLEPGVNNRLFFLIDGVSTVRSVTITEIVVRINIVPRWRGIRDV